MTDQDPRRVEIPDGVVPQGAIHERECKVPGCDTWVRYVGYHPGVFLCSECGFPDPAPEVGVDEHGRGYVKAGQES